jgi:hypothetical protein
MPQVLANLLTLLRNAAVLTVVALSLALPRLALAEDPKPAAPPAAEPPPPPPAQAAPSETDKLGEQGRDAYRTGNYAEAFRLFEKAFVLDDSPRWLYNMAKCKEKIADYREAVRLLERYLELFRARNPGQQPPDLVDVQHLIRDLKQRAFEALPEVEIKSVPTGAQVLLGDGTTIGSTPVNTHMEPGRYKIVLKMPNHTDLEAELAVPQSGKVSLVFGLKSKMKRAAVSFWCNIRGASVAVDGKVVAVTPYLGQLDVEPGRHQILMTKPGFDTVEREVLVPEDKLLHSRIVLTPKTTHASWRAYLGWPMLIVGGLAVGGGAIASHFADQEFQGTQNFKDFQQLQNVGYIGGGTAAGIGLALVLWDGLRDGINDEDKVAGPEESTGEDLRPLPNRDGTP